MDEVVVWAAFNVIIATCPAKTKPYTDRIESGSSWLHHRDGVKYLATPCTNMPDADVRLTAAF